MAAPVIFDGRNIYAPGEIARHGFRYFSIGRPPAGGPKGA
jgi:UDPglucose 6-dehydrogenase